MKIKVILFEDNNNYRKVFSELINSNPKFECVGSFPNCTNIIKNIKTLEPDVILMDIEMPYISGIDAIKMVKEKYPDVEVIIQTIFDDDEKIFQSIYAGASGYILKNTSSERILEFIFDVYNGGAAMSPSIATKVLKMVQPPSPELKKDTFNLTEKEIEVLTYIAKGMNNKTIADCCFITIEAVKKRISSIYEKLHVHSKSEAIAKAFQNKIL